MVIDVHCHIGLSAKRVDKSILRFSFEADGARGTPGFDSYLAPRLLKRPAWWIIRRWLGVNPQIPAGDELDAAIISLNEKHYFNTPSVDRLVLLAFDEYYDDQGHVHGRAAVGQTIGSDLYVSNSYVRAVCAARPDKLLLGGSLHPYRTQDGKTAVKLLEELVEGGAALIKWLPIHQNMRAEDPRTIAFLRKAHELSIPMLIHYGGESSLAKQHTEFEHPGPMLNVLRQLKREGCMPTIIVAHAASPSFFWQDRDGFDTLISALREDFADAPLYADISALAVFGRTPWLKRLAKMREVHRKLIFGTDYPIPPLLLPFRLKLDHKTKQSIADATSWIEQDYLLKRALGFDACVFTQAAKILRLGKSEIEPATSRGVT